MNLPETPEDIRRDIAALGNICRFNGHVRRHYSVAEHTAIGLEVMMRKNVPTDIQRAFALHDLPEAYMGLGDVSRDRKSPFVKAIIDPMEHDYWECAAIALDHDLDVHPTDDRVKYWDRHMAVAEVEAVALCDHDDPSDYAPMTHGYAAARIQGAFDYELGKPRLLYHFIRLFPVVRLGD